MGGFFALLAFIFLVYLAVVWSRESKKANANVQEKNRIFEIEKERDDNPKYQAELATYTNELPTLGYPNNYRGFVTLFANEDGTVHFGYKSSPNLRLVNIEFQAEYNQVTKGSVSGKTGSSIVGGLLLGTTGAVIGGSGSRKIKTTTTTVEKPSDSLLTFDTGKGTKPFSATFAINKTTYNWLKEHFVWLESDNVQSTIDADGLADLAKLHDQGIITDDEFSSKKKQLLGL